MPKPKPAQKKPKSTSAESQTASDRDYECELWLDSCDPESLPVPSRAAAYDSIVITGRFADGPVTAVVFRLYGEDGDLEDDEYFVQDGDVERIQFNKIRVPYKLCPEAEPGARYFTVTQRVESHDCTVVDVDLAFSLT